MSRSVGNRDSACMCTCKASIVREIDMWVVDQLVEITLEKIIK